MFTFSPMPHAEAVSRIAGLPLVSREVMDELLPELRAYAFTVTGLDRFDQLAKVRDVIAAVPAGEQTWAKARKEIAAELSEDLGGKVAQRRAELLLRTHVFRSYAASRYRRLMQQVDVFPFWQYKTHGDGNVRPSHAALNGKIFPAGHDIWQRIFPPWDWGCRCLVVPLTKRSAEKQSADFTGLKDSQSKKSAESADRLLPTQIARPEMFSEREADLISKNERLPNGVPLLPAPTWASSPWSVPGTVQHDWRLIEKRYDDQPEVLAAFKQWAEKNMIPDSRVLVAQWLDADLYGGPAQMSATAKKTIIQLDKPSDGFKDGGSKETTPPPMTTDTSIKPRKNGTKEEKKAYYKLQQQKLTAKANALAAKDRYDASANKAGIASDLLQKQVTIEVNSLAGSFPSTSTVAELLDENGQPSQRFWKEWRGEDDAYGLMRGPMSFKSQFIEAGFGVKKLDDGRWTITVKGTPVLA